MIGYDEAVLKEREYTGTPVLFPTPNRVRDCVAYFEGIPIKQHKNGKDIFCHELVHDEQFELEDIVVEENCITAKLCYTFSPEKPYFSSFPFCCCLRLIYKLTDGELTISYELENKGKVILKLPSEKYLLTDNMFPTGDLIMTEESFSGLSTSGALMSKTELDHNFLRKEGESAFLFYPDRKMTVELKASEDFCHYVVHSPRIKILYVLSLRPVR